MSYEDRIYIVKKCGKGPIDDETGLKWCSKIARFDLGVVPYMKWYIERDGSKTGYFIYEECDNCESDVAIVEDKYGEPLTEFSIDKLIDIIHTLSKRFDCYDYRLYSLLAALESIRDSGYDDHVVCLHYGY